MNNISEQELLCYQGGTSGVAAVLPQLNMPIVVSSIELIKEGAFEEGLCKGQDESNAEDLEDTVQNLERAIDDACGALMSPETKYDLWRASENYPVKVEHVKVTKLTAKVWVYVERFWQETGEFPSLKVLANEYDENKAWSRNVYKVFYEAKLLSKNKFNRPMWPTYAINICIKEEEDNGK